MSIIDEKGLSNLSYTNKDFNSIYVELLDLVKKISYKWDPSVSDEGDPGVVLIKLAALLGDKLNYNIDKNVLELFPTSVSQVDNARKLFDQCGYSMKYYNSATTPVSLTLIKEPEDVTYSAFGLGDDKEEDYKNTIRRYKIPKFTMVTNSDNSCVYTIIDDVLLESTGKTKEANSMQGTINDVTVNGETLITLRNLDENNRLYFSELDVAENGIFIGNDLYGYDLWNKSDNLLLEPLGTPCYKFGVAEGGRSCYIEFPSDIDNLIGNGLSVKYIRTSGYAGNIGRNSLRQFFQDVKSDVSLVGNAPSDSTSIESSLTTENVYITNIDPASDGRDPESIQDAYKSYRRLRNVLMTLVTTQDFSNFLIENEKVSNCFVCDRTDDIQSTYSVMEVVGDAHRETKYIKKNKVEVNLDKVVVGVTEHIASDEVPIVAEIDKDELSAFDLRIYALQYVEDPSSSTGFEQSFLPVELVGTDVYGNDNLVNEYIFDDINLIQHDYKSIKLDEIFMIKNKYPIISRIIPYNKLTEMQKSEVLFNVYYALYDALNSKNMEFGGGVQYDVVYDAIMNSDNRIKAVVLEDIRYETYAIYVTEDELGNRVIKEDIRIDADSTPYRLSKDKKKQYIDYYTERDGKYEKCIGLVKFDTGKTYYKVVWDASNWNWTFVEVTESAPMKKSYYTKSNNTYVAVSNESELSNSVVYYEKYDDKDTQLRNKFRTDVFARSVVAGRTYLYEPKEAFSYSANQTDVNEYLDVAKITTNAVMVFDKTDDEFQYTVGENENVVFTQPNLIQTLSNGGYVKYFYNFADVVPANTDYEIQAGEALILFWKDGSEDNDPYKFSYYGKGSIICPTFTLTVGKANSTEGYRKYQYSYGTIRECAVSGRTINESEYNISNPLVITGTVTDKFLVSSKYSYGENAGTSVEITRNEYIAGFSGSPFVTTGTMQIDIKNTNKVDVTNSENGVRSIQWILNTTTGDGTVCVPDFVQISDTEYEYSMRDGEYLIYSNETHTQLVMLGRGTRITVKSSSSSMDLSIVKSALTGKVISYETLMSSGATYITENGLWIRVPDNISINATEMKYTQVGPGQMIKLTPKESTVQYEWYDYFEKTFAELPDPSADYEYCRYKITDEDGFTSNDKFEVTGVHYDYGTIVEVAKRGTPEKYVYVVSDSYTEYKASVSDVEINKDGTIFWVEVTIKTTTGGVDTTDYVTIGIRRGSVILGDSYDADALNRIANMPPIDISFSDFNIYVGDDVLSGTNSDELAWDAYSVLNISCNQDSPQLLTSNQSVNFISSDGVETRLKASEGEEIWLSSLQAVDVTGGENVTVELMDWMTGGVTTNSFCSFKVSDEVDVTAKLTNVDLRKTIVLEGENASETVDIASLTGGNMYLGKAEIHIESGNPEVTVEGGESTTVVQIGDNPNSTFIYFCIKDTPYKTGSLVPSVTFKISSGKVSLVIYPLLCVGVHPMISDSSDDELMLYINDVLNEINKLNVNGNFDFMYSIPESQLVKNPLESNSFLNTNHVMNPYTICQLQMSSSHSDKQIDISVTDKIK